MVIFRSAESNSDFFKSDFITADLNSLRKIPQLRDRFIMRVIMGAITLKQSGKRLDGRGSDKQVNFSDYKIRHFDFFDRCWLKK